MCVCIRGLGLMTDAKGSSKPRNMCIMYSPDLSMLLYLSTSHPPSPTSPSPSAQPLTQKQRGRKKVLRNRSKVYAALYESNAKLEKALQKAERYRKRYD